MPSKTAKWISFRNHKNRKVVGGKHNFLVHYLNVSAPDPSVTVVQFHWKSCYFVPSTTAKQILFLNHRNRKVVGGTHNVLVLYMDASATGLFDAVLCNPFKWDILLFILIENHVVCVPSTPAKWILFRNHKNRKVVGDKHNVLVHYVDGDAPKPIWCCPLQHFQMGCFVFISDQKLSVIFVAFHNSEMNFFLQPQR